MVKVLKIVVFYAHSLAYIIKYNKNKGINLYFKPLF